MSAEPFTLCLLVSIDDRPRPYQTEPDHTRRARIMTLDPDRTPRNIDAGSCHYDDRAPFADLAAEARTVYYDSSDPASRHMTYWRLRFEPVSGAELAELEPVLGTLRRIDRHLAKLAARYGPPATFGQYVARLADALRIRIALRQSAPSPDGRLNTAEYLTLTPAEAGEWLDRADDQWRAAHPNTAPERAA
jgi:hypothetical protein